MVRIWATCKLYFHFSLRLHSIKNKLIQSVLEEHNDHLPVSIIAQRFKHRQSHTLSLPQAIKQTNLWLLITMCAVSKLKLEYIQHYRWFFFLSNDTILDHSEYSSIVMWWLQQHLQCSFLYSDLVAKWIWQTCKLYAWCTEEPPTCCSGVWGVSCSHRPEACALGCVFGATRLCECQKSSTGSSSSFPFCHEGLGQTNLEGTRRWGIADKI